MTEISTWLRITQEDPGHSTAYVQRFRDMAATGADLAGEARLVDALVPRTARILDAGCGPGRVGAFLFAAGHDVVGVDLDPVLITAAEADHPGRPGWSGTWPSWTCRGWGSWPTSTRSSARAT